MDNHYVILVVYWDIQDATSNITTIFFLHSIKCNSNLFSDEKCLTIQINYIAQPYKLFSSKYLKTFLRLLASYD